MTIVLRVMVAQHVNFAGLPGYPTGLNGSLYWLWPWRTERMVFGRLLLVMVLAVAPLAVAGYLAFGNNGLAIRWRRWLAISLIVISGFAMQLAAVFGGDGDGSLDRVGLVVQSSAATSYYTDAAKLVQTGVSTRDLLSHYPQWLDTFIGHSQVKPPGPMLFYRAWISTFGDTFATAKSAGLLIAALAALTAAATNALLLSLGYDADTAICAAMFWALCPGPIVLLPELDQLYGLFTCVIVGAWAMGLGRGGSTPARASAWGAAAGLLMAIALFTTYALLVIGFILLALAIITFFFDGNAGRRRAFLMTASAASAFIAFYVFLYLASGFNPIATFTKILAIENHNLAYLHRTWPNTIGWDLLDFTLCSGWLGCLLAGMFLVGGPNRWRSIKTGWIAIAMLAQIVIIAVAGVLPSEVTRLWIFVLPILAVPVGLELRQWDRGGRLAVFVCMWILVTTVVANIQFIVL
jgi:hypothetical protein